VSDQIRVQDMIQSTEYALNKVLQFATEHPESQWLYESWQNLDRGLDRLKSYYRQQWGRQTS